MNKYNNGKIYKIVDNTNNNVYYGSTIETLGERLSVHKYNKNCRSRLIINNGDYDIILIENYPCESKEQLETRERHYIENNKCINKNIPGRNMKEWREDNKDNIRKYHKEWREDNKEKLKLKREYQISWGGDQRFNNNLLQIDINLFQ